MRFFQSVGCLTPVAIVIYGLLGGLLLGQFGGQALNYLGSMGWEQVSGTIISSEVEDAWDTTGERYIGRVLYTYEIGGTTYEGTEIDLRGEVFVRNPDDAARRLSPYPAGASLMVYVDPSDPTRAVLNRSLPNAIWAFVGLGGVLVLLSLGLAAQRLVKRREDS